MQLRSLRRKTASPRAGSPLAATSATSAENSAAVERLDLGGDPRGLAERRDQRRVGLAEGIDGAQGELGGVGAGSRAVADRAGQDASPPPCRLRNAAISGLRSAPSAAAAGMSSAARAAAASASSRTSAATAESRKGIGDPVPARLLDRRRVPPCRRSRPGRRSPIRGLPHRHRRSQRSPGVDRKPPPASTRRRAGPPDSRRVDPLERRGPHQERDELVAILLRLQAAGRRRLGQRVERLGADGFGEPTAQGPLVDEVQVGGRAALADHVDDRALAVLGHSPALEQLHERAVVPRARSAVDRGEDGDGEGGSRGEASATQPRCIRLICGIVPWPAGRASWWSR